MSWNHGMSIQFSSHNTGCEIYEDLDIVGLDIPGFSIKLNQFLKKKFVICIIFLKLKNSTFTYIFYPKRPMRSIDWHIVLSFELLQDFRHDSHYPYEQTL